MSKLRPREPITRRYSSPLTLQPPQVNFKCEVMQPNQIKNEKVEPIPIQTTYLLPPPPIQLEKKMQLEDPCYLVWRLLVDLLEQTHIGFNGFTPPNCVELRNKIERVLSDDLLEFVFFYEWDTAQCNVFFSPSLFVMCLIVNIICCFLPVKFDWICDVSVFY